MAERELEELLAQSIRRAQAAEHDRLVLFDELLLKGEREKIALGRSFDERLGIDTEDLTYFDRERWEAAGYDVEHFVHYEASPEASIERALEAIPFPIENATFVDVGCGKGRALLVAARRPFERVVGVELNPDLIAIARTNIAKADPHTLRCLDIEIVEAEASTFEMPPGDLVVYMYNPFDDVILAPVVDKIGSLSGRSVAIAYNYPKFRAVIDRHSAFTVAAEFDNGVVYRLAT
jgi:SAM-dependent methyltransferase